MRRTALPRRTACHAYDANDNSVPVQMTAAGAIIYSHSAVRFYCGAP
ncbi:MAG: hypothetical protein GIW99_01855 [Candidatus Eremiobacteraeota bacterium]|nr:hypothetical protein [Candidatus Eremiobacteraeota bacterium]MBC5826420.1 hypothetical protein [Candidatus Eremiobacteraeota bacterium]